MGFKTDVAEEDLDCPPDTSLVMGALGTFTGAIFCAAVAGTGVGLATDTDAVCWETKGGFMEALGGGWEGM